VGSAYTFFPGSTAEDLRRAILDKQSKAAIGRQPSLVEIGPGQVARQMWRGINVTPRTLGWGPTVKSFVKRIFPFVR
jgi:hypothetical protein